jgi:lipoprotein-anchoring transpeptidase ErfK/SrfK
MQAPRRLARLSIGIAVLASSLACQHGATHDVARAPAVRSAPATRPVPVPDPVPSDSPLELARQTADRPSGRMVVSTTQPSLRVWREPNGAVAPAFEVSSTNPWHQPLRFPVVARKVDDSGTPWVRILLGVEPNSSAGWVPFTGLTATRLRDHVDVDMSSHTLRWFRAGRVVRRFTVALGAPATPTTPGRFFVWASFPSSFSGAYGAYVLGLSGFSRVLTDWPGGGRMAIHGTSDPTDPGHDVSHGCVRVYDPQMLKLRGVPMGTLVRIHP